MPVTMDSTGLTYNDGTTQTTRYGTDTDTGSLISVKEYTISGSWTWYKPPNCTKVLVRVVGGGGGAAGYCESGGAGGFAEKVIDVTGISSATVTVGGGGGNTGYYAAGGDGGTSSFGSYCSASGGYGANNHASHTGGYSGNGSGGDLNVRGGSGTGHGNTGGREAVGTGGKSYFGSGYKASHNINTSNWGRTAPGAGGAGGAMQSWAGSYGGNGIVIVYNYS